MTKAAAVFNFWQRFGLKVYEQNSVPTGSDAPDFPYLTYELITDSFDTDVYVSVSLWYRESSWVNANAKADEISDTIGQSGIVIPCDDGAIWIKRGQPFARSMGDESDDMIKRKYLNVIMNFLTID